jgi:hypothetical protein
MTTQREIKRWVEPILQKRSDLGVGRGCLVMKPVHHLLRGLYIWRNRNKDLPKIGWFVEPLFDNPSRLLGVGWNNDVYIGSSSNEGFMERLTLVAENAVANILSPIESVEDFFVDTTQNPHRKKRFGQPWALDQYPREYGPVLAALGRLEEAKNVLVPWVAREEATGLAELAEGQELLAKRPNSRIGEEKVKFGQSRLGVVANHRRLLALIEARDRVGIGALLREWEQVSVKTWGVEHLYEPTAFPVEEGAGDQDR